MSWETEATAAMDLVFDTFKRTNKVTFYKVAEEEVIAHDPTWNADFGDLYSENIIRTSQSKEIDCRVIWVKNELIKSLDGDENLAIRLSQPLGQVKIQIKSTDWDWLKNAVCFYIMGEKYVKTTDWRGIGLLGSINRYEITLSKNQ